MAAKERKRLKKSVEDDVDKIYLCNLNFVPPKDKNLETIFEEPRQSKDGNKILTSKIKYKRYLSFDPTNNKIQKRKRKAKKCVKKLKTAYRVTRSSPGTSEHDVSLFIDILSDSSSDSDEVTPVTVGHEVKAQFDPHCQASDQSKNSSLNSESYVLYEASCLPRTTETLKTNVSVSHCKGTDSMCDSQGMALKDATKNFCALS